VPAQWDCKKEVNSMYIPQLCLVCTCISILYIYACMQYVYEAVLFVPSQSCLSFACMQYVYEATSIYMHIRTLNFALLALLLCSMWEVVDFFFWLTWIAQVCGCYIWLSRKRRQPRKNVTIQPAEPSTPRRLTREEILRDSPGRVTRR